MIRLRGVVLYKDGRLEEWESGTAAIAKWERYALRHKIPIGEGAPGVLMSMVVAHAALGIAVGFDAWEETVDSVETTSDGDASFVPPTLQAPSLEA